MGKASRLRAIRRAHRSVDAACLRVKLHATDIPSDYKVGMFVAMAGVKNVPRRFRNRSLVVTAVDEANGIITVSSGP